MRVRERGRQREPVRSGRGEGQFTLATADPQAQQCPGERPRAAGDDQAPPGPARRAADAGQGEGGVDGEDGRGGQGARGQVAEPQRQGGEQDDPGVPRPAGARCGGLGAVPGRQYEGEGDQGAEDPGPADGREGGRDPHAKPAPGVADVPEPDRALG
ncbi:hypothetical protein [Streptomyces virginiae]|uniref:hypothetical protein n=1 Tax=Streptomyces virginiae TaxID=1961 RepID=UPI0036739023